MTDWTTTTRTTVQHDGRTYRIHRRKANRYDDTWIEEYWPGRGIVGSYRRWLGHRHTERLYWYAAANPTDQPFKATKNVDNLPSRRLGIRWLLDHT